MGCGWLGLPLAAKLVSAGYEVNGSTTSLQKFDKIKSAGVTPYLAKLDPDATIDPDFLEADAIVINVPPGRNSHAQFLAGLQNLMKQVESSPIKKVIYVSSTSVYPSNNREVIEADASYLSSSRSGVILLETEDVWRNNDSFDHIILRFAGLFGPGRNPGRFLAGRKTNGGQNPVNMIHLDDCIAIIIRLLQNGQWNESYNACTPHHPSREAFYHEASKFLGVSPPIFEQPDITPHKIVNADKLINHLSYQFMHEDLLQAIQQS